MTPSAVDEITERVKSMDDVAQLDQVRRDTVALRTRLASTDSQVDGDLLLSIAECNAWACYRIGKKNPPKPGERTDLKGVATSRGAPGGSEPDVDRNALARCRAISPLTEPELIAELLAARAARRPITQTRLLERVRELAAAAPRTPGAEPKPRRVPKDVAPKARKIISAANAKLHELRASLPAARVADRELLLAAAADVAAANDHFLPPAPEGSDEPEGIEEPEGGWNNSVDDDAGDADDDAGGGS